MGEYGKRAEQLFMEDVTAHGGIAQLFELWGSDSDKTAAHVASGFGGEVWDMRELCGAVSGMFIVLGIVAGYSDPSDAQGKKSTYAAIQELASTLQKRQRV